MQHQVADEIVSTTRRVRRLIVRALAVGLLLCLVVGLGAVLYRQATSVSTIRPASAVTPAVEAINTPGAEDWNCWRGPNQDAVADAARPPVNWTTEENVRWSTEIPGLGHSSPIVWGSDVFVTFADEAAGTQSLECLDRETGQVRWTTELHRGSLPVKHDKNSHASATPACDGRNVYTAFAVDDAIWVSAVDLQGRIVWQTEAGPFESQRGYGSSPVLSGTLLIVVGDSRGSKLERIRARAFLTAVDTRTGQIVWRIPRTEEHSFGTPLVHEFEGRKTILLGGPGRVCAYALETGDLLWWCESTARRTASTIAAGDGLVFCSSTYQDKEVLAIRPTGTGDVTNTHVAWRKTRGASDVPSPLYRDQKLFIMEENGVLNCLQAGDGSQLSKVRLPGNFSSSPAIAGDHLYVSNEDGRTYVLSIAAKPEIIATNELGDAIFASPAFSGNRLLLRSAHRLWCLEDDENATVLTTAR